MRNKRGSGRLEALSDGVFAFAATLLVVSLEVPRTFSELSNELFGFVGFGVSFGALLAIWAVHHAYFRRYAYADGWTITLNGFLLFVVLFFVYPLKFMTGSLVTRFLPLSGEAYHIGGVAELGNVFALYSAGFFGVFLAIALMYRHAAALSKTLGLDAFEAAEARFLFRHYMLFVLASVASIALALGGVLVQFGFPGWVYALLGPLCWGHGVWSERKLKPLRPAKSA
jgi:uncharacterized membrane protein